MKKASLLVAAVLAANTAFAGLSEQSAELSKSSVQALGNSVEGSINLAQAGLKASVNVSGQALELTSGALNKSGELAGKGLNASGEAVSFVAGKIVDVTVSAGKTVITFVSATGRFSLEISGKMSEATKRGLKKAWDMGTVVTVSIVGASKQFATDASDAAGQISTGVVTMSTTASDAVSGAVGSIMIEIGKSVQELGQAIRN